MNGTQEFVMKKAKKAKGCDGCGPTKAKLGKLVLDVEAPGMNVGRFQYTTQVCSPACAARVLVREGWGFEEKFAEHRPMVSDLGERLWTAINEYKDACVEARDGISDKRMNAVTKVESVLENHPGARARDPRTNPATHKPTKATSKRSAATS